MHVYKHTHIYICIYDTWTHVLTYTCDINTYIPYIRCIILRCLGFHLGCAGTCAISAWFAMRIHPNMHAYQKLKPK